MGTKRYELTDSEWNKAIQPFSKNKKRPGQSILTGIGWIASDAVLEFVLEPEKIDWIYWKE